MVISYKGRLYKEAAPLPPARLVEIIEKGILVLNSNRGMGTTKYNVSPHDAKERARNIANVIMAEMALADKE